MDKQDLLFTQHAKERALERMLDIKPPYKVNVFDTIKELILINLIWHPIREVWVIDGYKLELVVKEVQGAYLVVTIKPIARNFYQYDKMQKRMKKERS